jgi:hypothetical protein
MWHHIIANDRQFHNSPAAEMTVDKAEDIGK